MRFTDAELERQRHANAIHELETSLFEMDAMYSELEQVHGELLEASKAARIELMWLIQQHNIREGGSVWQAHEKLKAAIAKAEGN